MLQIYWTPTAIETYEQILDFIFENWSMDVVLVLEKKVQELESRLQKNKYLCPASLSQKQLRRCVVTQHTSMLYPMS